MFHIMMYNTIFFQMEVHICVTYSTAHEYVHVHYKFLELRTSAWSEIGKHKTEFSQLFHFHHNLLQDLKDHLRQAGHVTYADAHKRRVGEGWAGHTIFVWRLSRSPDMHMLCEIGVPSNGLGKIIILQ